jgi:hypothetical protein
MFFENISSQAAKILQLLCEANPQICLKMFDSLPDNITGRNFCKIESARTVVRFYANPHSLGRHALLTKGNSKVQCIDTIYHADDDLSIIYSLLSKNPGLIRRIPQVPLRRMPKKH